MRRVLLWAAVVLAAYLANRGRADGAQVFLKDGRVLQGSLGVTASVAEAPQPQQADGSGGPQLILLVDDELRRVFVSKRQMANIGQESAEVLERFRLEQPTLESGRAVSSMGLMLRQDPFDDYGRRIVTVASPRGAVNIIQAITELTPVWTRVQGVDYVWDMRMATSSLPQATLATIIHRVVDPKRLEDRKRIVRFYLQADRYDDAFAELQSIVRDFAADPTIGEQLKTSVQAIARLKAARRLEELALRRGAGQHAFVERLLQGFPSENVPGETLQAVREMISEYAKAKSERDATVSGYQALAAKLSEESARQRVAAIGEEIAAELNVDTRYRLAAFRQMAGDENQSPDERLALAVSGWLVGPNAASTNLAVALSLAEVRELVRQYLLTTDVPARTRVLQSLSSQEGASPAMVAAILAQMKPAMEAPPTGPKPGYYELEVPGIGSSLPVKYCIQLPPEYSPLRRYPAILTLHGTSSTAASQIDWWAGAWGQQGWREGQATRRGYIVIAPHWAAPHQRQYGYSAQEHAAVLFSLRDACRRFAINTDKVFLSGHSMGGDAAWDIGLAHPDLWAGVIPIVATSARYVNHYWKNAARLPLYFVCGELDGKRMADNAIDLDRYLRYGYNATVVEYLGRGHEHFLDEVHHLFDWMGRLNRDFFPKEFTTSTMRPWDNFFWWVELRQIPSKCLIDPIDWPPTRSTNAMETTATVTKTGSIYVKTGAGQATVYLSPEMVNFAERVGVVVGGRKLAPAGTLLQPSVETILEDVRTRGDRQHPFWVKLSG